MAATAFIVVMFAMLVQLFPVQAAAFFRFQQRSRLNDLVVEGGKDLLTNDQVFRAHRPTSLTATP